ncbi:MULTISPECIES: hypothetical protein [Nitrosomonas]|uniref:Uncharacterized protein n=1 Tax=Nitrosomonas europaea (strain ATCC 19718 / CIP 103999 / KCTC 2705 / NBRC 14298) TaxID=228410 RepID=Q82UX7_NITEU|nr:MULTISPECIES: hypothetical protein [Nitrosomonas]CAD85251.1 hypothetical protein NE1340 [Nitrosomonas europaea ATCC 19718]SDW21432.1 hypothetical protein SAMN05216310_10579 [Nitrosomonas europaea]SES82341.1 hypothetical protein SAMN05216309_10579 [Nitrosomonas europaea]SJZ37560.1 hypothetical protein SAMN02745113_00691 [Nitrosomonas europaea]HBF23950.1 hypothetical protein [Nitrosomonas sp.]
MVREEELSVIISDIKAKIEWYDITFAEDLYRVADRNAPKLKKLPVQVKHIELQAIANRVFCGRMLFHYSSLRHRILQGKN